MTQNSAWDSKFSKLQINLSRTSIVRAILIELKEALCNEAQKDDFKHINFLSYFQELLSFINTNVIQDLNEIASINSNLHTELFESYHMNEQIDVYIREFIAVMWLWSANCHCKFSDFIKYNVLNSFIQWITPLYKCAEHIVKHEGLFYGLFSVIWNCVRCQSDLKYEVRSIIGLNTSQSIWKSIVNDNKFQSSILALTILYLVVDHEDQKFFVIHNYDLKTIVSALNESIENEEVVVSLFEGVPYQLDDVLIMLVNISQNDSTKSVLIKYKLHYILKDLIMKCTNPHTIDLCLQIIYKLTFVIKYKHDAAIEFGHSMKSEYFRKKIVKFCPETNSRIMLMLNFIIWELTKKPKVPKKTFRANSGQQLMISYEHDSRSSALELNELLLKKGYSTWMDIDSYDEDAASAITYAIENATGVIVCSSEKYKESSVCRSEATYARTLKKILVPISMQKNYTPNGWLANVLENKKQLRWQPHNPGECAKQIREIEKHLGSLCIEPLFQNCLENIELSEQITQNESIQVPQSSTSGLSNDGVSEWLHSIGMDKYIVNFSELNMKTLLILAQMERRCPEFVYKNLQKHFHMSFEDILEFSMHLQNFAITNEKTT